MSEHCRYFQGAVVIMTGGASGIGRAMAAEMSRRGATLVLADRQLELAQVVATELSNAEAEELDVRDAAAVEALVRGVFQRHGRLDFMFNNAGIGILGPVRDTNLEDWQQTVDVNINGVIHGVLAAYAVMREQGFGHIVNTASMAGLVAGGNLAAYVASKHAVVGLSKSLAQETREENIAVTALCPGVINTPILEGGEFGRLISQPPRDAGQEAMDPTEFARRTIDDIARKKSVIIHPFQWRIILWMSRLTPPLLDWLMRRRGV